MEKKKLLITKEAASMLRISEEYLRSLIRKKKLLAYKEGNRGGYRITLEAINRYIVSKYNDKFICTTNIVSIRANNRY